MSAQIAVLVAFTCGVMIGIGSCIVLLMALDMRARALLRKSA